MLRINKEALTFDDISIVPNYSDVTQSKIDLSTKLTKGIQLKIPVVSAAMDTVTESRLAIEIAKEGGIGFIHKNMSVEKQVEEVKKVKRYVRKFSINSLKSTFIHPNLSISNTKKIIEKNKYVDYLVVDKGRLVGIIPRDVSSIEDSYKKIVCSHLMIPTKSIQTKKLDKNRKIILNKILDSYGRERTIILDNYNNILGCIGNETLKKIKKNQKACIDNFGLLRVGAAISSNSNNRIRVDKLVDAGIDVLLIDSSHGHSVHVINRIKDIKKIHPDLQIIGGNVVTVNGAKALIKAGADAIKVGIGSGSICTTRIVTGVGVPQITAISDVSKYLEKTNIPLISDGGIRFSGDIAKAISVGADCVMIGSLLAGSEESPGSMVDFKGKKYKKYRGMGSIGAMIHGSSDRYFQQNCKQNKLIPEGIEGIVEYKGKVKEIIHQQIGGIKSCMWLTGCSTIHELQKNTKFVRISKSGIQESHIHDVIMTKKTLNYQ
ncbi:inosine-5'-monophosphate dehydrogenase [Candidatus Riesia sp. GBBU]|nr:inosine-5'-monophosphate dehydrogenase [Candidatus Riesia sp. GBBU]